MTNGELSVSLLTYMSPNTNVTHSTKAKLVSFWSFGMYLSFEPKRISLRQSADSQSTKYSVSELMVNPVNCNPSWIAKCREHERNGAAGFDPLLTLRLVSPRLCVNHRDCTSRFWQICVLADDIHSMGFRWLL